MTPVSNLWWRRLHWVGEVLASGGYYLLDKNHEKWPRYDADRVGR